LSSSSWLLFFLLQLAQLKPQLPISLQYVKGA